MESRTRLEAKYTKKIRGQRQPFQGQTLSRPKIGMLEAKAKDQGDRRKCFPKKRSSKFFSCDLQNQKIFKKIFRRSPKEENEKRLFLPVAYAGFSKRGGARKFRKFENNEDQNENFSTSPFSCPKSGEDQKKGLHSNLVDFWPKIG